MMKKRYLHGYLFFCSTIYLIPAGRTDTADRSSDIAIIYATVQAIPSSYG